MSLALALAGCGLDLEQHPVAYSCDHLITDAGKQCTDGWACGFDNRCFAADGGQAAGSWQCLIDTQCPLGWQCGAKVDGQRLCQQLGVGAASPCAQGADCQGGWRCSLGGRCFDPTEADGGASVECTDPQQCPAGFVCGQVVGGARHCLVEGVGTPAPCTSDEGCQGGWRCNTEQSQCLQITDVVRSGLLQDVGAAVVNPLGSSPVPLLIAASRLTLVPTTLVPNARDGGFLGVMTASLYDGGLVVTTEFTDENVSASGIHRHFEGWLPLPASTVASDATELALGYDGPALRFRDGGVWRLALDGGATQFPGAPDFLRQLDGADRQDPPRVVLVSGTHVEISGGPSFDFPDRVLEFIGLFGRLYAFTPSGVYAGLPDGGYERDLGGDGGLHNFLSSPAQLSFTRVLAAAAGQPNMGGPCFAFLVEQRDGGPGLASFTRDGTVDFQLRSSNVPVAACPAGTAVALSIGLEPAGTQAGPVVRCQLDGGATFGVFARVEQSSLGFSARHLAWAEDPVPFAAPFVTQHASALVRAMAGADRRWWHTLDQIGIGVGVVAGELPRPMRLDRQPDTIVSVPFGGPGVILTAVPSRGFLFDFDPTWGLLSSIEGNTGFAPLTTVANAPTWVVTAGGVVDVGSLQATGSPATLATLPSGTFTAPVSAAATTLPLNGHRVVLVSSEDKVWAADVTENLSNPYVSPAVFSPVLVPTPGMRLRSMVLAQGEGEISGYLVTTSQTLRFRSSDLLRWAVTPVPSLPGTPLPLEVWSEGDGGRVGTLDGRVWSLPIMVPLTAALPTDAGAPVDFARKCGDLFVTTPTGLFRAEPSDAGLPTWVPVAAANARVDAFDSLRLFESHTTTDLLHLATTSGKLIEVTSSTTCP